MEHWKAIESRTKAGTRKVKQVAHVTVHPQKGQKTENQDVLKDRAATGVARQAFNDMIDDSSGSRGLSKYKKAFLSVKSTKEDSRDKDLRWKAERFRAQDAKEDEWWQSGSQWRWEVITGRTKGCIEQHEKRKNAVETKESEQTPENMPADQPAGSPAGTETERSSRENGIP